MAAAPCLVDNVVMLERLISESEANAETAKLNDERFVREQRILDEQVPGIWKNLRDAMKAQSSKHPKHLAFDVCLTDEAVVRGENRRVLEVKLLKDSKVIVFKCNGGSGRCTFRLNRQNVAVICDGDGVAFPDEAYVADQLLSMILLDTDQG